MRFFKEGKSNDEEDDTAPQKGTKEAAVNKALNETGVEFGHDIRSAPTELIENVGVFNKGWARYPKNARQKPMKKETLLKLFEWYQKGETDKSAKISAETARSRLVDVDGILRNDWEEQMHASVAKIKMIFSKGSAEIKKLKNDLENPPEAILELSKVGLGKQFVGMPVAKRIEVDGEQDDVVMGTITSVRKHQCEPRFTLDYEDNSQEKLHAQELFERIRLHQSEMQRQQDAEDAIAMETVEEEMLDDVRRNSTTELEVSTDEIVDF